MIEILVNRFNGLDAVEPKPVPFGGAPPAVPRFLESRLAPGAPPLPSPAVERDAHAPTRPLVPRSIPAQQIPNASSHAASESRIDRSTDQGVLLFLK